MQVDIHGVEVIETPQLEAPAIPFPSLATAGLLVSISPHVPHTDRLAGVEDATGIENIFLKPADAMKPEGDKVVGFDTPYLINKRTQVPSWMTAGDGTAAAALDAIFARGNARVIVVPVENVEDGDAITDGQATGLYANPSSGIVDQASDASTFAVGDLDPPDPNQEIGNRLKLELAPANVRYFEFGTTFGEGNAGDRGYERLTNLKRGQILTVTGTHAADSGPDVTINFGNYLVNGIIAGSDGIIKQVLVTPQTTATEQTQTFEKQKNNKPDGTGANVDVTYTFTASAQDGTECTRTKAIGVKADKTGVYAMLNAKSIHGYAPRVIGAHGIDTGSQVSDGKNPLGAAIEEVVSRLRGIESSRRRLRERPHRVHTPKRQDRT